MNRVARRGLAVAVALVALTALFAPRHVTSSHPAWLTATAPATPSEPGATSRDVAIELDAHGDDADATADLRGNDVTPAVATYSFDALGSLYEVHSPQTELPRLGSPKT